MNISRHGIAAVVLSAVVCLGICGCGAGNDRGGADGTTTSSQPTTVATAGGWVATDSWGYTGAAAVQMTAPAKAQVVLEGHTLLEDALNVVVSGTTPSAISYSSDATTLPAAGQASAPGTFVSWLSIAVGAAGSALPALSVNVDVGAIAAGQTVNIYRYDSGTGKWVSPQAALVSSGGQVTFQAGQMALYGLFK